MRNHLVKYWMNSESVEDRLEKGHKAEISHREVKSGALRLGIPSTARSSGW